MKRSHHIFVSCILAFFLSGCASSSTTQSKFTASTATAIKVGMTKTDVTNMLGEPRSHSIDSDGNEFWQYRKNAKQGQGAKLIADITSFGITSSVDAEYQDILAVTFKNSVVSKVTYEENIDTFSGLKNHN